MHLLQDLFKIAAISLLIISFVVSTPIPSNTDERIALDGKVPETRGTGGGGGRLSNAGYNFGRRLGNRIGTPIGKLYGPSFLKGVHRGMLKAAREAKAGMNTNFAKAGQNTNSVQAGPNTNFFKAGPSVVQNST